MTVTLIILLTILSLSEIFTIICGYFPNEKYFYWIKDWNKDVIPLFQEDWSLFFNRNIEISRNLIISAVYFAASLSISSLLILVYFMKRRFMASQWPIALWKLSTFFMVLRILIITWAVHKFHYTLVKDMIIELEDEDQNEDFNFSLTELYQNGTIGVIPGVLLLSIPLNLVIASLAVSLTIKTDEWRRLNIKKLFY